jgi:hypothetical protein
MCALARAFARIPLGRERECLWRRINQHRASFCRAKRGANGVSDSATRPERAASTQAGFVSVERAITGASETQPKARLVLTSKPDARQEPHQLERKPARNGRSRAKRRAAATSGAGRKRRTVNRFRQPPIKPRGWDRKGLTRSGNPDDASTAIV